MGLIVAYFELIVVYFGRKRVIFFKVQLCTDAFLRRKALEKPFAAQTPPRKRGYMEDFARNKTFYISTLLINVTALLLRYVRVAYGKIAARQARGYGVLYEAKRFGRNVTFNIRKQSTGHTFTTSSLSRDDYG